MSIGKRIRAARISAGMTQDQLALMIGVSKQAVCNYESDRIKDIPATRIVSMARIFKVSVEDLYSAEPMPESRRFKPAPEPENRDVLKIPVIGYVKKGTSVFDEQNIHRYLISDKDPFYADCFAMLVQGDAMSNEYICDGDIVIVHPQSQVDPADVAVVTVNHESVIVRRTTMKSNMVVLIPNSTNPAFRIQSYDLSESSVDIIGKVVEVRHRLE